MNNSQPEDDVHPDANRAVENKDIQLVDPNREDTGRRAPRPDRPADEFTETSEQNEAD